MAENEVHLGRNVKRFREMLGIKQDALAFDLGISQQSISTMEQKADIDDALLERVAQVLKVPVAAIKGFNEEKTINIISNTYNNHDNSATVQGQVVTYSPSFNPMDKVVELYERMLELEREKNALLEKLATGKKGS